MIVRHTSKTTWSKRRWQTRLHKLFAKSLLIRFEEYAAADSVPLYHASIRQFSVPLLSLQIAQLISPETYADPAAGSSVTTKSAKTFTQGNNRRADIQWGNGPRVPPGGGYGVTAVGTGTHGKGAPARA